VPVCVTVIVAEVGRMTAGLDLREVGTGGKSGLRRAGCWVTPREGDLTESATENTPPTSYYQPKGYVGKGEMAR
jgi:hypothetical protein